MSAVDRLAGLADELRGVRHLKPCSWVRYTVDVFNYRVLRFVRLPTFNHERTIVLRDGQRLTYRLNRGDIQAIREIWLLQTYRPPFTVSSLDVVVDLGANIGFTSVYYATRYAAKVVVAVEPDPDNAQVLRQNLVQNGIGAVVLQSAVGPIDGVAHFERTTDSNLGRVADEGMAVRMMSMASVLDHVGDVDVDMLKIDIEGGEGALFDVDDLSWLDRVQALMVEFHLELVDRDVIVDVIVRRGFRFIPAGSVEENSADTFVRQAPAGTSPS